jgi:hypothetical protein
MTEPLHPDMRLPGALALGLFEAAAESARLLARQAKRIRYAGSRRGTTLRPGPGTPLWNELVKQALPLLCRRGSKAQLARILGVPRQRLQDCLKSRCASLDAERTLLLLCWVATRQQGREFAP